jgi:hypothetical protein
MADYNITAVTRRVVYTGSAGTGPYSFSFPVLTQSDLAVYKNATKLTLTTDYTVTISSVNGTGSVTLVSAATGSDRITIIGARTIERTTDFVTAGDLKASSLNEQLDSQIIMIQQLAEENKRTLKAPQYDPAAVEDGGTVNMVLPVAASRAGKTLAFDASGNPVVGEDIGNWRGNWAAGTAYTVRDLVKDGSNANVYRANTAHTSTGTTPISSNADSAKWDLVVDAASAAASAAAAAASEAAASASAALANDWATKTSGPVAGGEYSAKYHATNAASSASTASTAATNASNAQTAAEAARDATLAAYDSFDDRYLGSKSSDPTLDNDGNALVAGALYFNTVVPEMRLYTGSAWVAAYVSGASYLLTSNNLSELTATASTARTNLGLGSIATQASSNVAITGGSVNGTTVGASTAASGAFTTLSASGTATFTGAMSATANAYMQIDALTDASTIAVDMSVGNNFSVTLGGNRTLGNPTNLTAGQSGVIFITQDGTGSRTLAYSSYWDFPSQTAPTLTTTANAVDVLVYTVRSSTSIAAQLLTNIG